MSEYKEHIVKSFDDDIENINQLTTQMATLVEEQFKLLYHVIDTASPATIEDILENEMYFIDAIGLKEHLSMTRSNGLVSMIKQMKFYALAFQAK